MSYPENLLKHRLALLEMLEESFRDPTKRTMMKTRGISMLPFVRERDEIRIQAVASDRIAIGDIIAYRAGDVLLVHRVVGIERTGSEAVFYEKGDNNMYMTRVRPEQVLGMVVELRTERRVLRLRARRFRWLGWLVARQGALAVRLYAAVRRLGAHVLVPGSAGSRAARRLVYAGVQLPLRLTLALGRLVL